MEKAKTSKSQMAAVRRYDEKKYDRITVRVPKGYREELAELVKPDSVNGFIVKAIESKLNGGNNINIPDLKMYAKSAGMTTEEYILEAIKEKMQRQDENFKEEIIREKIQ